MCVKSSKRSLQTLKHYGQLDLLAPQGEPFGGTFLQVVHSVISHSYDASCCFCQLSEILFPEIVGRGRMREGQGTETQYRQLVFRNY